MIVFSRIRYSGHEITCKKWNNTFVTLNTDFWSLVTLFANDLHSWLHHFIHGNSYIILYVLWYIVKVLLQNNPAFEQMVLVL